MSERKLTCETFLVGIKLLLPELLVTLPTLRIFLSIIILISHWILGLFQRLFHGPSNRLHF